MTEEQRLRLAQLRQEWCSTRLLQELYGLVPDEVWIGAWRAWAKQRPIERLHQGAREFHRYRLETFFQQTQLLPLKWAGARLGMTEQSLKDVLDRLKDELPRPPYIGEQLVDEVLIRDFYRQFDEFEFTLFDDHSAFCRDIHAAIGRRFGISLTPLKCATAALLGEDDFAYDLDAITLEPLGLRYQVWLDLGKPMNLRPDACGLAFYARNRDILHPLVFGGEEPEIPPSLHPQSPAP